MSKKLLNLLLVIMMLAVLVPTTLAAPPAQEEGQDYIVVADDWLSKLADKYLGNPMAYPAIVDATNKKNAEDASYAKITDPDLIEVGWKIYIPGAAKVEIPPPNPDAQSTVRYLEKVDDYTVKIYLNRVDPVFMAKMAQYGSPIMSPEAIKKYDPDGLLHKNPVGTGPFILKEWIIGDRITLERNDNYWGEKPKLKTLVFRIVPEASARLIELQAGTVDGIAYLAPDDLPTVEADPNLTVFPHGMDNIGLLGFNRAHPPFDKVEVRQAISYAIDKEALVEAAFPPQAQVATQFVPPVTFGYSKDLQDYPYDPDKAKELLAEAGLPDGFKTTLWVMPIPRTYYPYPDRMGQIIQADLKEIGIEAEIVTYEWSVYFHYRTLL